MCWVHASGRSLRFGNGTIHGLFKRVLQLWKIRSQKLKTPSRKLDRLMITADKFDAFYDKHSSLLQMLLDREITRKKWRNAVIEKTLIGLVWVSLVFVLSACWEWVQRHMGTRT